MSDDSSRERGGSAGSHLLHLISRNAPRVIGAAWVVAEAAARRVADVIQAVRAEAEPTRREPESPSEAQAKSEAMKRGSPSEAQAKSEGAEPRSRKGTEPRSEPKRKGQTATRLKKGSKKSARPPKPEKRAAVAKPPEKKQKARTRSAKKSKS